MTHNTPQWTNHGTNFYNAFWRAVCQFVPMKNADLFYPEEDIQKHFRDVTGLEVFQTLQAARDCFNIGSQLKKFSRDLDHLADYTPEEAAEILLEMTFAVEPSENPEMDDREHLKNCTRHIESYLALAYAFSGVLAHQNAEFGPALSQWMEVVQLRPADSEEPAHNNHAELVKFYEEALGRPLAAHEKLSIALFGIPDDPRITKEDIESLKEAAKKKKS